MIGSFDLAAFVGSLLGSLLDPVLVGLALLAGLTLRNLWAALLVAVGVGLADSAIVGAMNADMDGGFALDHHTPARVVLALLLVLAVWWTPWAKKRRAPAISV